MRRLLLLFLLPLVLLACRNRNPTVSFAVFGDPAEFAAYEALVDAFHQAEPDIRIALRHIPSQSEYRQRLATDFSAGRPPDVMLLNYRRFATFAAQGGLTPLGPYLETDPNLRAGDFFPIALDAFRYGGALWCIPQNISSLVVYYNADLFAAAGLAPPGPGWTWDDFLAVAQVLTQDTTGDGVIDQYGAGVAPTLFRLAPFVWQLGGDIVDDAERPSRLTLDSPQSQAALRWLIALQTDHGVVPGALAEAAEASEVRFLNGTLAMFFNSRRGVPTYRTIKAFHWDVAPLPTAPGGLPAGILHSDAYCLAAGAAYPEAAWRFIAFANGNEGQRIVARSGRTVPSLIGVADSTAFLDPLQPPAGSEVFVDTAPILRRVPVISTWAGVEETASREIARAFYGQATIEEATEAATALAQPFFERAVYPDR